MSSASWLCSLDPVPGNVTGNSEWAGPAPEWGALGVGGGTQTCPKGGGNQGTWAPVGELGIIRGAWGCCCKGGFGDAAGGLGLGGLSPPPTRCVLSSRRNISGRAFLAPACCSPLPPPPTASVPRPAGLHGPHARPRCLRAPSPGGKRGLQGGSEGVQGSDGVQGVWVPAPGFARLRVNVSRGVNPVNYWRVQCGAGDGGSGGLGVPRR